MEDRRRRRTVIVGRGGGIHVSGSGNIVAGRDIIGGTNVTGVDPNFAGVQGSGHLARETRDLPGFEGIKVASCVDVQVTFGAEQKIEVEADDNLLSLVEVAFDGSGRVPMLNIDVRESLTTMNPLVVHVTMPKSQNLQRVIVAGSGDVVVEGMEQAGVMLSIRGSGDIRITGEVVKLSAQIQGSGDMKLRGLASSTANLEVQGSGDIKATVTRAVNATVMGSGDITIFGNPPIRNTRVMGSGDIEFD